MFTQMLAVSRCRTRLKITSIGPFSELRRRISSLTPELQHDHELFNYTRGRFVRDESYELSQRRICFDIKELKRVAAATVGSKSCVTIEKYPDGLHSKAFLLTMDDGMQVVAKIPNPNAEPPRLLTASEAATMDFMRTVCKIPVPQVYTWNSRRNAVGAEYILMEKVPGVTLDTVWAKMHISDQFEVIKRIARYQETWMSTSFNQYGSVYFAQDLEGTGIAPLTYRRGQMTVSDKRYAIGPSVGREYFDAGRSTVQFDRGPWPTLEAYLAGIGHREISCVKNVARLPRSPISLYGPGIYQPTRERKIKAIESYLAMIRYIAPANQSIASPCLWHGDLHVENIFVNPEAPTEIVGIIDWQSTQVAPLFYQARQPYFLDHEGVQVSGLERPQLPENFETLDNDAKKEANSLYFKQCLSALYRKFVYKYIPRLYSALEYQATPSFDLLLLARNLFIDGEATYLARVVELESTWSTLPGVIASKNGDKHYPFCFSDAEKADIEKSVNESLLGMQVMQSIQDTLGDLFPEKGIVKTEQYDEAKNALGQIKEQIIEQYAKNDHEKKVWEKEWPFDD